MNELEIIQYQQIEGLTVFFDTVDYRTPHIHTEWELIWLLDNPLSVTCGQSRFEMAPGQMILFCPDEPHEFHKLDQEATFLCLQISPRLLPQIPLLTLEESVVDSCLSEQELRHLHKQFGQIARSYLMREANYELYCIGESFLILHKLLCRLPYHVLTAEEAVSIDKRNARLNRLIRFVDENYMHKIRLADFAAAEGCSLSYLSRFIKDTMNQTFQEYVTSVRFNCACKLIAGGNMRMLDICMESGFSDYRYFSRAFQQQFHMTPEQYSQYKSKMQLETYIVRHSLHSAEKFYSREDSLKLLKRYITS